MVGSLGTVLVLCTVLGEPLLSQCHSSPRSINGYPPIVEITCDGVARGVAILLVHATETGIKGTLSSFKYDFEKLRNISRS